MRCGNTKLSKSAEHRAGVEPASPPTTASRRCPEGGVVAARPPVLAYQVGPAGLEPSPGWVRASYAAANTLIPSLSRTVESARKESNLRPGPYKSPALTTELRAVPSGAGGIRGRSVGLCISSMDAPGRFKFGSRNAEVGVGDSDPNSNHSAFRIPNSEFGISEQLVGESNPGLRLEGPASSTARRTSRKSQAHSMCHRLDCSDFDSLLPPQGRRHAVAAHGVCLLLCKWVGRRSNPRPLVFSQVLDHLSYRPIKSQRKRPGVL